MTTPTQGTVYGLSTYSSSTYGLSLPAAYQCAPMSAVSIDYGTVSVTWVKPTATYIARWRLIANRYGYPVDENDGSVVIDDLTYPGSSYLDQAVIPGTYHYYGFYVLADVETNLWVRSGFAACLTPVDYASGAMLLSLMPEYFRTELNGGDLTDDASGNSQLVQFTNVLGWMWDYIKTQYDVLANHLNDPMFIPLDDLWNMAAEVGLTFSPDVPAYTVRKAVANQAHVSQNRGTVNGIIQEISIRTGWGADVQVGPNIMLVDDQAQFLNPVFETYSPSQVYRTPANCYDANSIWHPEWSCVWQPLAGYYGGFTNYFPGTGYWYQCATDQLTGVAPPVNGTSNAYWTCVGGPGGTTDSFLGTLINPVTNSVGTWEALDSSATNSIPVPQTLTQGLGVLTPGNTQSSTNYAWNALRLYNKGASAKNLMIRSVSRRTQDLYQIPDFAFESGYALSYVYNQVFNGYNTYYGEYSYSGDSNYGVPWLDSTWPLVYHTNYSWNNTAEPQILRPGFWAADNCLYKRTNVASGYVHSGSYSVLCTPLSGGNCRFGSPWIKVAAGTSVIGSFWTRPNAAGTVTIFAELHWYDQYGSKLSVTAGTAAAPVASTWTQYTVTATAPASTVYAAVHLAWTGTPTAADAQWLDDTSLTPQAVVVPVPPELIQAVQDGIPVPWIRPSQVWNATTQYSTNDITSYGDQPFIALTASTGITPPTTSVATANWAPLSQDPRIRLLLSGETSQDLSSASNLTAAVIPFVEWYDQSGNYLARVFSRNPNALGNVVAHPGSMAFDSFTTPTTVIQETGGGPIAPTSWAVSYYQNITLSGTPVTTGTVPSLVINWNGDSPATGISGSGWSAQFTGSFVVPAAGTYVFTSAGYGGVQVFVNGLEIINNWSNPLTSAVTGSISLLAGATADVVVNYNAPYQAFSEVPGPNVITSEPPSSTAPESWTTTQFPVISGLPYQLQVQTITPASTAQITWYGWGGHYAATGPAVYHPAVYGWETIQVQHTGGGVRQAGNTLDGPGAYTGYETSEQVWAQLSAAYTSQSTVWVPEIVPIGTTVVTLGAPIQSVIFDGIGSYFDAQYGTFFGTENILAIWETWEKTTGPGFVNLSGFTPAGAIYGTLYVQEFGSPYPVTPARWQSYQQFTTVPGTLTSMNISAVVPTVILGSTISSSLNGRTTDDETCTWVTKDGAWIVGGYGDGTVWPANSQARSLSVVSGLANTNLGVTFRSAPAPLFSEGLVFRYSDDSDYWRCGRTGLYKKATGIWTQVAIHSTPFSNNDRMSINLNGSSIIVYRNNVQVTSVTDAFNDTAILHGIVNETNTSGVETGAFTENAYVKVFGADAGTGGDVGSIGGILSYRATPTFWPSAGASGAPVVVTAPSNIAAGDLILLAVANGQYAATFSCPGFSAGTPVTFGSYNGYQLLSKTATGTETSFTVTASTASYFTVAQIVIAHGSVDATGTPSGTSAENTAVTVSSVNVPNPSDWVLLITGAFSGASSNYASSVPAGFTFRASYTYQPTYSPAMLVADMQNVPAGATGTFTATLSYSSFWTSQLVVIR